MRAAHLCGLVLGACLLACAAPPAPTRIGTNVWIGYEPLFLARDDGLVPPDVRLVELTSATQAMWAVRNASLEGAALTLDEALRLAAVVPDLEVIAALDESAGADAIVSRSVTSVAELKGKRVAVEEEGVGWYLLLRALSASGLSASDVTIVPSRVLDHEARFLSGEVDAVVTFEPTVGRLRALGGQLVFTSRQIPGEIIDVLAVRSDQAGAHRSRTWALLAQAGPSAAALEARDPAMVERAARRLGTSPGDVVLSLEGVKLTAHLAASQAEPERARHLREAAQRVLALLMSQGAVAPGAVDIDRFIPAGRGP